MLVSVGDIATCFEHIWVFQTLAIPSIKEQLFWHVWAFFAI
jgi:hypothetical protein